jgi:hypothetical protein
MRSLLIVALVVVIGVPVLAHRVFGRNYPALTSALVQSPSASPVDLPLPLWDTGLSVICFKVTNTSRVDTRITAVGLELPGRSSGFALVSPVDAGLTLQENVEGVPGFPGVTLDVAIVTGANFTGGRPRLGLPPGAAPMTVCVSGPFNRAAPIETLLNGVFVRFESADPATEATDIGVWERRQ